MILTVLFWCLASIFLPASCHAIPRSQQEACAHVAHHPILRQSNARFLNSTYYPQSALNASSNVNEIAFCEVYGSVSYGNNDTLIFALWLPVSHNYNDRFVAVGNGGMAGYIDYIGMLSQLNSGLGVAVVGGNAGHSALENNVGVGAPGVYLPYLHNLDQVQAWIHNAISLFTPAAKAWTQAYHGRRPRIRTTMDAVPAVLRALRWRSYIRSCLMGYLRVRRGTFIVILR